MKKSIPVAATLAALVIGVAATSTALAGSASTATADRNTRISGATVVAWNQELLKILLTPGAQPATVHPTRSYAMLHAAIDDAIVSITRDGSPLLVSVKAAHGARPDAAAIEAGRATLTALYPSFKAELATLAAGQLATIPDGADKQHGIQVGDATAAKILELRANDGSAIVPPPFTPGNQPGNYRSTPPNFPTPVFTNWGAVTPFVLKSGSQFRPEPPPALTSAAYAQGLNEVKSLGQNTSTTRTADQTVIGKFWAPPIWNTWNVIAENAAVAHHANLERTARLFAVLNLSFADSAIAMYDAKYQFQLWRPITAIRLADTDGNPATAADPTWTALANTAADPSYPGAHSTISAAGATVLASVFGNRDQIQVTSSALPGTVRTFDSYSDVATEAGLSRIFAGQHFRFDHVEGLELGHEVAQFVIHHAHQED
ncbi:MAG TPA: phosphatase PAP2 family protein [Candidatus Dormibacteraeota bacterium]